MAVRMIMSVSVEGSDGSRHLNVCFCRMQEGSGYDNVCFCKILYSVVMLICFYVKCSM